MEYITPQLIFSIFAGVSLAACAGLRIFLPLVIASGALRAGWMSPNESFVWLTHDAVFMGLMIATFVEIGSYLVPWLDNVLDMIAAPIAVASGTLLAATAYVDVPLSVQLGLGLFTGGAAAGFVHFATSFLRAGSTKFTGGLINPFISRFETLFAGIGSFVAIFLPLLAFIFFVIFCFIAYKFIKVILLQKKMMQTMNAQFASQYASQNGSDADPSGMKTVYPSED